MSGNIVSLCLVLCCIWNCVAEPQLDEEPQNDQDIVVTISKGRNGTGKPYTKVNLEDVSEDLPVKQNIIQINVDNDSKHCTCVSKSDAKKSEPPAAFYQLIPGMGYYRLHTDHNIWIRAKVICEREGTHLAIMNSPQEVEILQEFWRRQPKLLNSYSDNLVYLGYDDIGTEGRWKTVFNTPLSETGYVEWERGEPNNGTNEDCGCMHVPSGKLHDCICSDVIAFFCEKEL